MASMKRTREEMENLATKCLILLSQGTTTTTNTFNNHQNHESATRVFECKTCSRQFPSFQALGGHRASHKKPRLMGGDLSYQAEEMKMKPKTHECSICGLEFTIGQALGGHMRRHRASISEERLQKEQRMMMKNDTTKGVSVLKRSNSSRRILCLDLDLNLNLSPPSSTPVEESEKLNEYELDYSHGVGIARKKLIDEDENSAPMIHWFF